MGATTAPKPEPTTRIDCTNTQPTTEIFPAWLTPLETIDTRLRRTIPAAMQAAQRWVVRKGKQPFYTDGSPRSGELDSPEDTAHLGTFEDALCAYNRGGFDGLGFALAAGWQGIDLDKVEANSLTELAAHLPGYVERSPSGKGFHAIGYGAAFQTLAPNQSGVEAYSGKRYFTITGDQGHGAVECIADFVARRLIPLHNASEGNKSASGTGGVAIIEGNRNATLTSMAGVMRNRGMGQAAIESALLAENKERCNPPLPDSEVRRIAQSVSRYTASNDAALEDASEMFSSVVVEWSAPTHLPNALPHVDPFDAELLPLALRAWVMDIAHRMQCPADFSAVGAIAALSSLIGARAVVQPKERDDWQVVPNLWAMVVGRPGVMKSPALSEVMRPLNRLEATGRDLFKAAHDSWELDCKVSKIQDDTNERKAKGYIDKADLAAARALLAPSATTTEPVERSYVETNTTMEALGVTLVENPWGLIVYRDEIYSFLTTLDSEENQEARGFYLQAYDGNQGYKFKRITRGKLWLERVCVAMLGGIQPGKIARYVRDAVSGGNGDDGLLQRFGLTVWPDIAGEFINVDKWPDTPDGHPNSPTFGHLKFPHPDRGVTMG
jgi:hypothetical protein